MSTVQARPSLASRAGVLGDRSARHFAVSAIRGGLTRSLVLVLVWHERARQRHELKLLSEHQLRDIGLSRADVEREASRPFWQP